VKLELKWRGTASDGTEVEGKLTIPEVSHEITLDQSHGYEVIAGPSSRALLALTATLRQTVHLEFDYRVVSGCGRALRFGPRAPSYSSRNQIRPIPERHDRDPRKRPYSERRSQSFEYTCSLRCPLCESRWEAFRVYIVCDSYGPRTRQRRGGEERAHFYEHSRRQGILYGFCQ
jgi:hypothetical protein